MRLKYALMEKLSLVLIITLVIGTAPASASHSHRNWKQRVAAVEWFHGGRKALRKGHIGYVYDIKSGLVIKVRRKGGHNHMDLEPFSKTDGKKMKKLGASWDPRPAILYANGAFIACSINTMPHGRQTITDNGFKGQFCLHMLGSKTHGGKVVRGDHQRAIRKAYRWAHR